MRNPNAQHKFGIDNKTDQFDWLQRHLDVSDEEIQEVMRNIEIKTPGDPALHYWDAILMIIAKLVKESKRQVVPFIMLLFFIIIGSGCASFPQSQIAAKPAMLMAPSDTGVEANPYQLTDAQCYNLLKARDGWLFAAKLLGGLGTAGAITTPLPAWNDETRWGLGAGAAALTVGGVAAMWIGESKSKDFEQLCEVRP